MLSEGYRSDILDKMDELRDLLISKRHTVQDFQRVRFRSYECENCRHNVGKQQLVAMYHLEKAQEVIEADSRIDLDEYGDEVEIIHPTD